MDLSQGQVNLIGILINTGIGGITLFILYNLWQEYKAARTELAAANERFQQFLMQLVLSGKTASEVAEKVLTDNLKK